MKSWASCLMLLITFFSGVYASPIGQAEQMVRVNRGSFQMGNVSNDKEGDSDEKPVHAVTFTYDFWIGKTEVTFEEYDAFCVEAEKRKPSDSGWGRGNRPVINVSWWDAIAYCNWLSKKEGIPVAYQEKGEREEGSLLDRDGTVTTDIAKAEGYRLPTESEWEFSARGGQNSKGFKYSGSNDPNEVTWYNVNSRGKTQPVGQKKPNELGLYDMSGNVWEWCHDWYCSYASTTRTIPTPSGADAYRIERGGCWGGLAQLCRVACRGFLTPESSLFRSGFRLARTISSTE